MMYECFRCCTDEYLFSPVNSMMEQLKCQTGEQNTYSGSSGYFDGDVYVFGNGLVTYNAYLDKLNPQTTWLFFAPSI